ncbi:hypothetical protein [Evansella halocellulosilytica]|uniref:hypothetical protein n=1 Tax=Evansella halocellulosilytica TaxID=2011013 RepID=UPI000BB715E4|nr:hypothetical protein [Evansella halocellulosilytica]
MSNHLLNETRQKSNEENPIFHVALSCILSSFLFMAWVFVSNDLTIGLVFYLIGLAELPFGLIYISANKSSLNERKQTHLKYLSWICMIVLSIALIGYMYSLLINGFQVVQTIAFVLYLFLYRITQKKVRKASNIT